MEAGKAKLVFVFTLATLIPGLLADIAVFDEVWQKRAEEAKKVTLNSYVPNLEEATNDFNFEVNKYAPARNSTLNVGIGNDFGSTNRTKVDLDDDEFHQLGNSTRRNLRQGKKKYLGPCKVTNPIDRCWRCRRNWARNRKRLAKCALGFGRRTIGGMRGSIYVVTENSDDDVLNPKPGSLRHAKDFECPV